jgi:hypothetical protein
MDVTWGSYHRRQEILRLVAARAEHGVLSRPWHGVPHVALEFESDAEVLQELHHWWVRVLVARLHGLELNACTRSAYDEVAAAHVGLRAVLDAYAGHPALAEGLRRERSILGAVPA